MVGWVVREKEASCLHENEVALDELLNDLVLPQIPVLGLGDEVGGVNDVDHEELVLVPGLLRGLGDGLDGHDVKGRAKESSELVPLGPGRVTLQVVHIKRGLDHLRNRDTRLGVYQRKKRKRKERKGGKKGRRKTKMKNGSEEREKRAILGSYRCRERCR